MLNGKMVFRVHHLPSFVSDQGAAFQLCITVAQPQRGIHHVKIIIKKGKTQIVRPYAVGTMLIHTQRSHIAGLRFQLLVKRRKAAVKPHHQGQVFTRRQINQAFGVLHVFRQRFIHADVDARIEQLAYHLIVGGRGAMHKDGITLAGQILQRGGIRNAPGCADTLCFFTARRPCALQRPVGRSP